jgi:hypothetical protein
MMSATFPQLQGYRKQSELQKGVCKYGLKINKITRINNMRKENVTLGRRNTDQTKTLFYLRSVVTRK